jgi:hypothetical protein
VKHSCNLAELFGVNGGVDAEFPIALTSGFFACGKMALISVT